MHSETPQWETFAIIIYFGFIPFLLKNQKQKKNDKKYDMEMYTVLI